jgi:hypothetical protein
MQAQDMATIVAAVQAALAAKGGKATVKAKGKKNARKPKGRQKLTDAEKAVFAAKNDADCITAFAAKGIQDVKPRENVLTYRKWFEKGRLVNKGVKATRVGPFNLFHISETSEAPAVIGA